MIITGDCCQPAAVKVVITHTSQGQHAWKGGIRTSWLNFGDFTENYLRSCELVSMSNSCWWFQWLQNHDGIMIWYDFYNIYLSWQNLSVTGNVEMHISCIPLVQIHYPSSYLAHTSLYPPVAWSIAHKSMDTVGLEAAKCVDGRWVRPFQKI